MPGPVPAGRDSAAMCRLDSAWCTAGMWDARDHMTSRMQAGLSWQARNALQGKGSLTMMADPGEGATQPRRREAATVPISRPCSCACTHSRLCRHWQAGGAEWEVR